MPSIGKLKQQTSISHSSAGWKVQGQDASRFGAWWGPLPGLQMAAFSLCPHMVKRDRVSSGLSPLLVRTPVPPRAPTWRANVTNDLPLATPQNTTHGAQMSFAMDCGGHNDLVHNNILF